MGYYLLVVTMIASSLMDKQGRKSLLITSFSGMVMPLFNKSYDYFISQSAELLTYSLLFLNLEGCFYVTSSSVLHLESSGALFWDSCCCWHCSVSCLPYLALLINMLVVYMKPNIQHNWNVTLCRYVLSFALGAGPVPALLLPEIFASRIRAKAVALSLGMHWVSHNCSNMHK